MMTTDPAIVGFTLPFWFQIVLICVLLLLSGLFSGLNLGLMALDQNDLKVIASCGTKTEKKYAATIFPLRSRGNFLLCSLLLGNVLVNTTLTALLDDITGSGMAAVATATLSIVVVGEIIPQAICSRHGLAVGAKTIFIPYIFMAVTAPLSYPISMILDKLLGEEIGIAYNREQLMEYIRITKDFNKLEDTEVGIISGALGLKSKVAGDILTPLQEVFSLPVETRLNYQTIKLINEKGFSRIPVYEENDKSNIIGILHTRDLALIDPSGDGIDIKSVLIYHQHPIVYVYNDTRLDVVLEEFKKGKSHLALVRSIQTIKYNSKKRNSRKISIVDGTSFKCANRDKNYNQDYDQDKHVNCDDQDKHLNCDDQDYDHDQESTKRDYNQDNKKITKKKKQNKQDNFDETSFATCLQIEEQPLTSPEDENDDDEDNSDEDDDGDKDEDKDQEIDPYYKLEGIITLEDIIEEILGAEISDESDIVAQRLREKIKANKDCNQSSTVYKKYSTISNACFSNQGQSSSFSNQGHSQGQSSCFVTPRTSFAAHSSAGTLNLHASSNFDFINHRKLSSVSFQGQPPIFQGQPPIFQGHANFQGHHSYPHLQGHSNLIDQQSHSSNATSIAEETDSLVQSSRTRDYDFRSTDYDLRSTDYDLRKDYEHENCFVKNNLLKNNNSRSKVKNSKSWSMSTNSSNLIGLQSSSELEPNHSFQLTTSIKSSSHVPPTQV